jgi:predicted 2-oxoglutarate/Fe(II)-dependent dioxygenase YbiX
MEEQTLPEIRVRGDSYRTDATRNVPLVGVCHNLLRMWAEP